MPISSTNAWSVINVMRKFGVRSRADVIAAWVGAESVTTDIHGNTHTTGNITLPVSDNVDDGLSYLTLNGFVNFDGTNITPTRVDSDGRPWRLRRVPGDETRLEYLPDPNPLSRTYTPPEDGT